MGLNQRLTLATILVVSVVSWTTTVAAQVAAVGSDGVEVLTRGPVHEAFAAPIALNPTPPVSVAVAPPADVNELPAEIRPNDASAQWINGYWNWDDERNTFVWVSGLWRVPPPGRQWLPGYWVGGPGQYQRVSGFWAPLDTSTLMYLPAPPQSLEAGPTVPATSPNDIWIPGSWSFSDGGYVWQNGSWAPGSNDWVFVPPQYIWTPSGYLFSSGYWDYPPTQRGLLFAPVAFRTLPPASFAYAPSVLLSTVPLLAHLFSRPQYGSYYFGDYYAPVYATRGYYPSFAPAATTLAYDPLYQYQQWRYARTNPTWATQMREQYNYYVTHPDARPQHTFVQQQQWAHSVDPRIATGGTLAVATQQALSDPAWRDRVRWSQQAERLALQQQARQREQFARSHLSSLPAVTNRSQTSLPQFGAGPISNTPHYPPTDIHRPGIPTPFDGAQSHTTLRPSQPNPFEASPHDAFRPQTSGQVDLQRHDSSAAQTLPWVAPNQPFQPERFTQPHQATPGTVHVPQPVTPPGNQPPFNVPQTHGPQLNPPQAHSPPFNLPQAHAPGYNPPQMHGPPGNSPPHINRPPSPPPMSDPRAHDQHPPDKKHPDGKDQPR